MIINFIRGFMMALANSVPGVSGGTIAFLMGFYDEFIGSLADIISGPNDKRKKGILFLCKIGVGFIVGFIAAVFAITALFEKYIYQTSALFLGFIVFAIPIVIKEEKEELKGKYINIIFAIIGLAIVLGTSLLSGKTVISGGVSLAWGEYGLPMCLYLIVAGSIAVLAMVLPGISGSSLLFIMGLYIPVMTSVKEVFKFNFAYVPACIFFGIGILLGVLCGIRLLKKCLEKHRSKTVYLIIGLMIGSIYSVILGPTTIESDVPGVALAAMSLADINIPNIICFVIGGAIILGLDRLKTVTENKIKLNK